MTTTDRQIASQIYVAFDCESIYSAEARSLLGQLHGTGAGCKIGQTIAAKTGWPAPINEAQIHEFDVFADAKLHEINNTVHDLGRVILSCQPDFINIFADSSIVALEALLDLRDEVSPETKVLGVTLLTDKTDDEVLSDYGRPRNEQVLCFANKVLEVGLDGVICSPQDLRMLAKYSDFDNVEKVTPGIRPAWSMPNDQQNYATPTEAIEWGASRIVVGRPITEQFGLIGGLTPRDAFWAVFEEVKRARAA